MSHEDNSQLFERASDMIGEYEGTIVETAIRKAMEDNDLWRLEYLVSQAEAETSLQEFNNHDIH
jgi:hypothetical protein